MKKLVVAAALRILSVAVALYLVFVGALFVFQRDLLFMTFRAETFTPQNAGVPEMQVMQLTSSDGVPLTIWYAPPKQKNKPVILMFNGQAGIISDLRGFARWLLNEGYGVMVPGYRGYAGAPGKPSEAALEADALQQAKWLDEQKQQVVLYGISLGTGIAVDVATKMQVRGVILQTPYASIMETAQQRYWFAPVKLLARDQFDSLSKIRQIKAPLFIYMGTEDEIIGPAQAQKLFDAAEEPKQILWLKGRSHNDIPLTDIRVPVQIFLSGL